MKKHYTFKWKKIVTLPMILFSWFSTQAYDYCNPVDRSYNASAEVNSLEHISFNPVCHSTPVVLSTPTLNSPTSNSSNANDIFVDFTLPLNAMPGSVTLTFTGSFTVVVTFDNSFESAGQHSTTLDGSDIMNNPFVASSNSFVLPDDTYSVQLAYLDTTGNSFLSDINTNITYDSVTLPPVLISPSDNASTTPGSSLIDLQFTIPETPLAGTVKLTFTDASNNDIVLTLLDITSFSGNIDGLNFASTPEILIASSNSLADGIYDITLEYQDSVGNSIATDTVTGFSFDTVTLSNDTFQFNNFTILPNPTSSKIVISTKENIKNISLISSIGFQFHIKIDHIINEKYSVDMSNLSNGVYFVVIETDSTYYTKKIIKK
ncbi:T9SS type A sorting domain-containing protein [Kordia sp.]|uniref:T9SS type A sorting domain-containing protein n=1 Tax=Kordia sp. TaxID=1965332 RepID=UPI003D6A7324